MVDLAFQQILAVFDLGGPVVMLLMLISVLTVAVVIYKLWQFSVAHVGKHSALRDAVNAWDAGDRATARLALGRSKSYLAPVLEVAFDGSVKNMDRLQAQAEERFARLEKGFRFLDSVAQLSPLLGLFGTVLGMIEAFQALQNAGAQVDPSLLAGGIWVALLTTAVGLVVAMPTAMVLAWFEGRMDNERVVADSFILTVLAPANATAGSKADTDMVPVHG